MMNLQEMRARIDIVDTQLIELLNERFEIISELAVYKAANGLPAYDAAREEEKIKAIRQKTDKKELADYYEKIFRAVMTASRESEELDIASGKAGKMK